MKRTVYRIDPRGTLPRLSAAFMAISLVLRVLWAVLWPHNAAGSALWTHTVLPVSSAAAFIVIIFRFCRKDLRLTAVPVFLGVAFFIIKAGSFVWWHQLLCTLLYLLVAALYSLTVFGILPTQKLLIPLFGLPLAFHLFIEDLIINRTRYAPADWVAESSVLLIMAALLCLSLAMEKEPAKV